MNFHAEFQVRGIPKAQPRHQAFAKVVEKPGQKPRAMARVYQKNTAENWKSLVVAAGRDHRPDKPLTGPVFLRVVFLMPRPQRLKRKRDAEGVIWHTARPDRDNLMKALMDSLSQDGWWCDDSQVCTGPVDKYYHSKSGSPGAEIEILELTGES